MKLPASLAALVLSSVVAAAQPAGERFVALTVWDLKIGDHASQLPQDAFGDYACGTIFGPPALPLEGWTDYAKCRAETGTGYHEVYFRYDDEAEYIALARYAALQPVDPATTVFDNPVIVSALFDDNGFFVGVRLITDTRVDISYRERASSLAGRLVGRFGSANFQCVDLPPTEGETPYQGAFIKRRCDAASVDGMTMFAEAHHFRKLGQTAVNLDGPTQGLFEGVTRFQAVLAQPIRDPQVRLANLTEAPPSARDLLIRRALDCPGCDLRGADLKRADLRGANLAGANLDGANLHAANLDGANLAGASLLNANLNRADFRLATMEGAVLAGAMLYAARFDGANLSGATLDYVLAGRAVFSRARLDNASIVEADLRLARLNDADFTSANLSFSALDDVQMTRAILVGANLAGSSLWRITLTGANLTEVNARGADFFGANLRDANLTAADFSDARLTQVNLSAARTEGANFTGTRLPAGFVPR